MKIVGINATTDWLADRLIDLTDMRMTDGELNEVLNISVKHQHVE